MNHCTPERRGANTSYVHRYSRDASLLAKQALDAMRTHELALKRDTHNAITEGKTITESELARTLLNGRNAHTSRDQRGGRGRSARGTFMRTSRDIASLSTDSRQIAMLTRFFGLRRRGGGRGLGSLGKPQQTRSAGNMSAHSKSVVRL